MAAVREHTPSVGSGREKDVAVDSFENVIGLKCSPCPDAVLDRHRRVTRVSTSLQGQDGEISVTYIRNPGSRKSGEAFVSVNGLTAAFRIELKGNNVTRVISVDKTQPYNPVSITPRRGFFGEPLDEDTEDNGQRLLAGFFRPVGDSGLRGDGRRHNNGSLPAIVLSPTRIKDVAEFLQDPKRHLDLLGFLFEPLNPAERRAMGNRAPRMFVF